jgi:flagellar biosynthesis chaperone FliJ
MAKNKKIVDLAPKIKESELKELQEVVSKIQQAQSKLGQMETQKFTLLSMTQELQMSLRAIQDKLEKEYGNVSISIQDGTITEVKNEADKKN